MEGKARFNQRHYKLLKVLEIVAAALIPLLAGYHEVDKSFAVTIGILSVFIVLINALQQLYKYHENRMAYRTSIEALKREKFLFQSAADPYHDGDTFRKFVQNVEELPANENRMRKATWMQKAEHKQS